MEKIFSTYSKIENPSTEMVLFTFVLSFILSCLIAFTYEKTTQSSLKNYGAIQAFILCSTVATMILQAIGDNIASSLAMLGALTVVQFRTRLNSPRESVFMFASLGVGIACGLYGFFVALVGGVFFCFSAFAIRWSPFHFTHLAVWDLKLASGDPIFQTTAFQQLMNAHCQFWTLESISSSKPGKEGAHTIIMRIQVYRVLFRREDQQQQFMDDLEDLKIQILDMNRKDNAQ